MLCDGTHPYFSVCPTESIVDYGDLNLPNTNLIETRKLLEKLALTLFQKHHMIWLGGDHSITLSLLRACKQHHGNITVLFNASFIIFIIRSTISCFAL